MKGIILAEILQESKINDHNSLYTFLFWKENRDFVLGLISVYFQKE